MNGKLGAVVGNLELAISTPVILLKPFWLHFGSGQYAFRYGQELKKPFIARDSLDAGATGLEHRLDGGVVRGFPCDGIEHGKRALGGLMPRPREIFCDGEKTPDHLVNPGGGFFRCLFGHEFFLQK